MIPLSANIVYSGPTPDITAKEFNFVKRLSYKEMGEKFWRENLPRRFTSAGGRMLNYAPRAKSTQAAKRRRGDELSPLVKSGASKRLATTIRDVRSTSTKTKTRTRIVLHARALNYSEPRALARGVKPSDEVRRIAEREVPPLMRFLKKRIVANFQNIPFNPRRDKLF